MTTASNRIALIALLVGVAAGVGLAACASAPARAPQSSAPAGLDQRVTGHDPAIEALDQEIGRDLEILGLAAPTDPEITEMMVGHATPALPMSSDIGATCEQPPATETCSDVCTLASSICRNAGKICDLADQLAGDDWAAQRCTSGKASCERATERCCGC